MENSVRADFAGEDAPMAANETSHSGRLPAEAGRDVGQRAAELRHCRLAAGLTEGGALPVHRSKILERIEGVLHSRALSGDDGPASLLHDEVRRALFRKTSAG